MTLMHRCISRAHRLKKWIICKANLVAGTILACIDRIDTTSILLLCHNQVFEPKLKALQFELNQVGFRCRYLRTNRSFNHRRVSSSKCLCICFAFDPPIEILPQRLIVFNFDPIWEQWLLEQEEWMRAIGSADSVWSFTPESTQFLKKFNKSVSFVPLGHSDYYRLHDDKRAMEDPKDFDLLFFGQISSRRSLALDELEASGLTVRTITWSDQKTGSNLWREIRRSRAIICIHKYDDPQSHYIDLARLDQLLSNGVLVLHEEIPDQFSDWTPDCPIPYFSINTIGPSAREVLSDDARCQEIARECKTWFQQTLPLSEYIPFSQVRKLTLQPSRD